MTVGFSRIAVAISCAGLLALTVAIASAQGGGDLSVTLNSVGGSGASAVATLTAAGNQTDVTITASGFAAGTSNEPEVHFGTCANTGGIAFSFPTFTANAAGQGTVSATVPISLATLQDGNHLFHIHLTSAEGNVLACGNIPVAAVAATATPAATAVAVATSVATATATATAKLPVTGSPGLPMTPLVLVSIAVVAIGILLRPADRR
jgi:hypothetical protein